MRIDIGTAGYSLRCSESMHIINISGYTKRKKSHQQPCKVYPHKHPKDALPHGMCVQGGLGAAAPNKQNEARRCAGGLHFWRCGYHKALLAGLRDLGNCVKNIAADILAFIRLIDYNIDVYC